MHFIDKLLKIKYKFPPEFHQFGKISQMLLLNFMYILHFSQNILSFRHRICQFQQYVFPTEEFWGNRMQLSWNAHLLGSQKAVCIIYPPFKSQTVWGIFLW